MKAFTIRPLVWETPDFEDYIVAYTIIGEIEVYGGEHGYYCDGEAIPDGRTKFSTQGDAKAAAELAYQKFVMRAMEPLPSVGQRSLFE